MNMNNGMNNMNNGMNNQMNMPRNDDAKYARKCKSKLQMVMNKIAQANNAAAVNKNAKK